MFGYVYIPTQGTLEDAAKLFLSSVPYKLLLDPFFFLASKKFMISHTVARAKIDRCLKYLPYWLWRLYLFTLCPSTVMVFPGTERPSPIYTGVNHSVMFWTDVKILVRKQAEIN